jgi:hypothetical protein
MAAGTSQRHSFVYLILWAEARQEADAENHNTTDLQGNSHELCGLHFPQSRFFLLNSILLSAYMHDYTQSTNFIYLTQLTQ